jgi:hypothetical protein
MNTPSSFKSAWDRSTTRRFFRWLTSWHILRRVLLGFASLLTLVAVFYAVEDWRGSAAWKRHCRELEAIGEKGEIASLIPPPVPDGQNLAMAPLLKPIFEYDRGPHVQWHDPAAMERLRRIDIEQRGVPRRPDCKWGNLYAGSLTDLDSFRRFYLGNTNYPQAAADAGAGQVVLSALTKYGAELDELKAAAAQRPLSRFPINYLEEPPTGVLLPHLAIVKRLAQACSLRATARLDLGQPGEALDDIELGFRLSAALRDEPLLIDHLVRIATLQIVIQSVREGLARHAWSAAQLARMELHLAAIDLLAEHQLAMRGERAYGAATIEYIRRQGWHFDPAMLFDQNADCLTVLSLRLIPGGWCQQNKVRGSQILQNSSLAAVDLKTRRVDPQKCIDGEQAVDDLRNGPYTVFVKLLLPAVTKATSKSARLQTYVDCARVACALERFRLAQGRLPDALAGLVPQFLPAVPSDVIDGQPLRYRLAASGEPLLHSIGWNQTDERGKRAWTGADRTAVNADEGDWVWGPSEQEF